MRNLLSTGLVALLLAVVPACVGSAPGTIGDDDDDDDNGVDAGGDPDVDAGPDPIALTVSGMVMDYFAGDPLPEAVLATDGLAPPLSGTAGPTGAYALDNVPPGSTFYVSATRLNYRPTHNDAVRVLDIAVENNVYLVSNIDTQRQYATLDLIMTPGTSMLIADLKRNNGTPLEGVPLADITLVDALGAPVGVGPYFFGPEGDVVSNAVLATSISYGGRARAAFLNVPPGIYSLRVNYIGGGGGGGGGGGIQTFVVPSASYADGVTLVSTGGLDDDQVPTGATFAEAVYPLLQKASQGGLACANCHQLGGVAALLPFNGPVAEVQAAILAAPGVVNLITPLDSLLLTKPLYEDPPNHPNATFLNAQDPYYIVILNWIEAGAL